MVLHEGGDYHKVLGIEPPTPETIAETTPLPQQKEGSGWVHRHPYLAIIVGIAGLLVLGGTLFIQRTDVAPARSSGAWGGAGGMFFGTTRNALSSGPTVEDVVRLQSPQDSYAAIPIYTPTDNSQEPRLSSGAADIAALLSQLVQQTPVTASAEMEAPDSYSFIPQGLISTEPVVKQRTPEQEDLFDYGNDVGTLVKSFEDTHGGAAQILKDHVEDRSNPSKINALKILGQDLQQLGRDLRSIPNIPEAAAGMHRVYANAYYAIGGNLVLVADTTTDEEFLAAITKYNSIVDALSTQFQLLVILFGTNEVTFSSSDPGVIFMFNPNVNSLQ